MSKGLREGILPAQNPTISIPAAATVLILNFRGIEIRNSISLLFRLTASKPAVPTLNLPGLWEANRYHGGLESAFDCFSC